MAGKKIVPIRTIVGIGLTVVTFVSEVVLLVDPSVSLKFNEVPGAMLWTLYRVCIVLALWNMVTNKKGFPFNATTAVLWVILLLYAAYLKGQTPTEPVVVLHSQVAISGMILTTLLPICFAFDYITQEPDEKQSQPQTVPDKNSEGKING